MFLTAGTEDLDLGKRADYWRATFRLSSLKLYAQLLSVKCFIPSSSCLMLLRMPMFDSGLYCNILYAFTTSCLYYALMRHHD